ncbi:MAG: pentapeptide repeat-containing protein [Chloroflexi bacterium]|nr:pentapeptide repeat-containing protein [Chloroflexota bacterium]MCC6892019.1 pentapeptide repeat-containing protein [Anaerolineae bacterium]
MLDALFGRSKNALIQQMGSSDNKQVLKAVELLKAKGWFRDGSLHAAQLEKANLRGAALARAEMQRANLRGANLTKAYLGETQLKAAILAEAVLHEANMRSVVLTEADLSGADLSRAYLALAHLTGTNFQNATLHGTNFWQADLSGANLEGAAMRDVVFFETRFNEQTVLPDGSRWTTTTEWARFTDPNHAAFWLGDSR